jgi:hypothetical protein
VNIQALSYFWMILTGTVLFLDDFNRHSLILEAESYFWMILIGTVLFLDDFNRHSLIFG